MKLVYDKVQGLQVETALLRALNLEHLRGVTKLSLQMEVGTLPQVQIEFSALTAQIPRLENQSWNLEHAVIDALNRINSKINVRVSKDKYEMFMRCRDYDRLQNNK